jgi:hypothetical protein
MLLGQASSAAARSVRETTPEARRGAPFGAPLTSNLARTGYGFWVVPVKTDSGGSVPGKYRW